MLDLIIRGANLPDGRQGIDIGIEGDKIATVELGLKARAGNEIDAKGRLVTPPFVDAHFHMDATLSLGLPRLNQSGTLLEGIALWGELKPLLTQEAIAERALAYCDWAVAKGLLAIRSHVDICDPRLLAVDALLEVKKKVKPYLDLQLVAFPQDGVLRSPGAMELLKVALDRGVDVVGGIPHFERTMADGAASVRALCEIAAERGLLVDMHCDETDDPMSRHVETLAYETQRLGLQGRVTGSHLTSMHSMDNYYVSKLIPLMAEARLNAIANPLINITIQGRHDTYPKRRGMTRVPEPMPYQGSITQSWPNATVRPAAISSGTRVMPRRFG
jgi:cytosine deaminase